MFLFNGHLIFTFSWLGSSVPCLSQESVIFMQQWSQVKPPSFISLWDHVLKWMMMHNVARWKQRRKHVKRCPRESWLFSLSSWFLMSFSAAVLSDRCCSVTVDACFIELSQVCSAFSDDLPQYHSCCLSVICSYTQYFFFLLFIFLIELVAGVLAYVYYQRVSAHYLTPELNYCFPLEQ